MFAQLPLEDRCDEFEIPELPEEAVLFVLVLSSFERILLNMLDEAVLTNRFTPQQMEPFLYFAVQCSNGQRQLSIKL
jgi:hypothetical protein